MFFRQLYMTTSNIPNGFSMDDLQSMMENAAPESTPKGDGPHGDQGLTNEELEAKVDEIIESTFPICNDPLFHKVMAMRIILRMMVWHKEIAKSRQEDDPASAGCWMRDAGKFQAVMDILTSIQVGPDDFTCSFTTRD